MTIRIIADEREKPSQIPDLLKIMGIFVDYDLLKVGDYIISSDTAIERKTVYDLINSVYDGRIFVQCSDLVAHYSKPLIIIEGNIADLYKKDDEEGNEISLLQSSVTKSNFKLLVDKILIAYDTLIKVSFDFKIPILYTPSTFYTAELLVHLASAPYFEKSSGPLLKKIKKTNPVYIQQLYVLTSLPGIGVKLATRLLEKFHSPINVLNASVADLARVPGVGNMRAEKIKKILDTSDTYYSLDKKNDNQTKLIPIDDNVDS